MQFLVFLILMETVMLDYSHGPVHSESSLVLIHIQSSVITFNLSLTSSKGAALTCVSFFSLFEAQPPNLCVVCFQYRNLVSVCH